MKKQQQNLFDVKDVGFKDLDGQYVSINIDQKDFANAIFSNATSIDMDDFARAIHKNGSAELNEQVREELAVLLPQLYKYRVASAILETLEKTK